MRYPLITTLFTSVVCGCILTVSRPANASLTTSASFNGNVGLSSDGCGTLAAGCDMNINVPVGSSVLGAYLYTSIIVGAGSAAGYTGTLSNGANSIGASYTSLGISPADLGAGRMDVTAFAQSVIGGGSASPFTFHITESNTLSQDGEGLVVVFSNPLLGVGSVGILDGFSSSIGDSTSINFVAPLDPTAPGFRAEMRIGDGYSCCDQTSTITVNGTTITTNAGNNDDSGITANGALITVGGDDDPFSPLLPSYADDHERYNLVPYIGVGDTAINVHTSNPSNDDNIFLATFLVSGTAGFNQPPPSDVPEPASILLLGLGLAGLSATRNRLRRR